MSKVDRQPSDAVVSAVRHALVVPLGALAHRLDPQADLGAHGIDSASAIEVVFAIEEALGVELPDDLLSRDTLRSIDSLSAAFELVQASS